MNSYWSIIKADYLQRTRSYAFLITLLVSVCLAYTFIPPATANYSTVRIGKFVGENNPAWIGHVTAIMSGTFLWLFGFYLVNNGIKRDKETGVGQVIATTSISNFKYLLAKALSNFFVLLSIMITVMIMALFLVFTRGGNYTFDAEQFFLPYLITTIPSIFFVSALAVFAEVIFGKYTILQNIAFFIFFILIFTLANSGSHESYWLDVSGTKPLTDGMVDIVNKNYSQQIEEVSVGFIFNKEESNVRRFLFSGSQWSPVFVFSRLVWICIGMVLLLVTTSLFRRFDEKVASVKKKKVSINSHEEVLFLKEIHLSTIPVASPAYGIFPFLKIELLMLTRKGPSWFWLINIAGLISLFFIPLSIAHQVGLPVLWFLQVNRWADIATRERYNRTHYFSYASYNPLQRLLTAQIIAGIILAIAFALPVLFRYIMIGDFSMAAVIISGAFFLVSFSVFSGIVSGGKRLFEIIFFMLTYANISGIPALDYFGGFNHGISYSTLMLLIICTMLVTAYLFRRYEIRNQ